MRVYVINMREAVERRAAAERKLDEAGIAFEFFDGISGEQAIAHRLFDGFADNEFLLNTGRKAAPGEIGCFASHRALWAQAAVLNEPIMIMEDDFDLLDSFPKAVRVAEQVINEVGYLRLQVNSNAKRREIARRGEFSLSIYTKAPHCMMCYCISPEVARQFIEDTRVMDAPVDVFIKKYWEHGQPLYALTPYPVAPSILSTATTITGRQKKRKPLKLAIQRLVRKCGWHLQRSHFNFRQRWSPAVSPAKSATTAPEAPAMVIAANASD